MNEIRVMHISESFGWSGGAVQALALAIELKKKDVKNIIACPENGDLWKKANAENFEVIHFRPKRDYDIFQALKLAKLLDEKNIQILHAHHPKAHAMGLMAKVFSRSKPIFIVTRRVSHPILPHFFARLKYINKFINGYIAVADSIKKILLDYGIEENKVVTVYSGVDTAKFTPQEPNNKILEELKLPIGAKTVGLIGNFSEHKGQKILLKAAIEILKKRENTIFVFAGRNTDSSEMRELAKSIGVPEDKMRLLGLRSDVSDIISTLSLSVNCAIKGEALSGSIRESMAMGIPVIAGDISGNKEIVINGKTGILYTPGDWQALVKNILSILDNEQKTKEFCSNGIKFVRDNFSSEIMGDKIYAYYKRLLTVHKVSGS
ncbi:MAG: glycosyltransferase family 4 protein [Elusimicrobia bacterium]|nr:glycosyltransferase family 4 protein [Elusimicrobiota bacterium]